jgi:pimeloyl-ACP methyl ester carboxylesterase
VVRSLVLLGTGPGQLGAGELPGVDQGDPPPPEFVAVMSTVPANDDEMRAVFPRVVPFWVHRCPLDDAMAAFDDTIFDRDVMIRGFEVLAGWSSVDRLGQIDAPTLLVTGAHDVMTSPPQARRIASRVPYARLELFEDSGHFMFLDEPERFVQLVGGWLDDH